MFQALRTFILNNEIIPHKVTLIVGFSGGPDSVFLLHLLVSLQAELSLTLIAAHLDHGWRAESAQDALWCSTSAQALNVPSVIKHFDDYKDLIKNKGSLEDTARQARRLFFKEVLNTYQAHGIALGHHADDQIETFFIRLFRGAHLEGLGCMRMVLQDYIRPLLHTKKVDILGYLQDNNIAYLKDSTNNNNALLRNSIRNTIIPVLNTIDNRFNKNCLIAIHALQESNDFIQSALDKEWSQMIEPAYQQCTLKLQEFKPLSSFSRHHHILKFLIENDVTLNYSKALLAEIERFIFTKKVIGSHTIGHWKLLKNKTHLFIKQI